MKLKNIIVIGKSKIERRKFINNIVNEYNTFIYRIDKDCNSQNSYIDFIKKNKLYKSDYKTNLSYPPFPDLRYMYSHHSWIRNLENEGLIVIDEIDKIDEMGYIFRTISTLMIRLDKKQKGEKQLLAIASLEDIDRFYELMCRDISYKYCEKRTEKQIIEQNIKIIDIAEK